MKFDLVPHPDHPPLVVEAVAVQVERSSDGSLWVEYCVKGIEALIVPAAQPPERADGLWKATCFELFFKASGADTYREFNFSPSFRWAAYEFDAYRRGRRDLAADDPEIEVSVDADPFFFLAVEPWPPKLVDGEGAFGLSAVIEETDGIKSYWALAHGDGPPDFHNPDCFTARLPAPDAP